MTTLQSAGFSLLLTAGLAAAIGCGGGGGESSDHSSSSSGGNTGGAGGGGGSSGSLGMPCDVTNLLTSKCISCHASPPVAGAPMPLLDYADLTAHSKVTPAKTYAELGVERMKNSLNPMPPLGSKPATAEEIAAMESWVKGGMQKGSCDPNTGPNPFTGPPVCSSNTQWTMGTADSNLMLPGAPCVACHNDPITAPKPPSLALGGTVYQTGHEPDNCNGGPSDPLDKAIVEITDANKQVIMLQVNGAGNFFFANDQGKVAMPFTARVLHQGKERAMKSPQKDGDCNACHTQNGTSGAPGRIALPG